MAREDPWRIPIPGVRFVVFQAFLTYLYTDHLKVARYFAPDVLVLAQRFHAPRCVRRQSVPSWECKANHGTKEPLSPVDRTGWRPCAGS